jgi:hypothetical protein
MEFTKEEVTVIAQTSAHEQLVELSDSQLLLVGGGNAEPVFS